MSANKIKKPILLIHGEEDNNSGTLTMQVIQRALVLGLHLYNFVSVHVIHEVTLVLGHIYDLSVSMCFDLFSISNRFHIF